MPSDSPQPVPDPQPVERPWQFSLLHLFGLTTVVSICAAAFYRSPAFGTLVSSLAFLSIAIYYRTQAVVKYAAPSLREHSLPSLVGFGVATSFVACLASLVTFFVTCTAAGFTTLAFPSGRYFTPIVATACFLGVIPALIVLYRGWPRRPLPK